MIFDLLLLVLFGWFICLVVSKTSTHANSIGKKLTDDPNSVSLSDIVLSISMLLLTITFWLIVGLGMYSLIKGVSEYVG